jgi:penicillin-binding protein activator
MRLVRLTTSMASLSASLALLAGCASSGVKNPSGTPVTTLKADEEGWIKGTGVESQDMVRVTDKMARGVLGVAEIANAATPPRIVMEPIINDTRFPVNKSVFLDRIRAQLGAKAQGKVVFLARERMDILEKEQQLKQSGAVTSTSDPRLKEFKGADYFLTGKLTGMSTSGSAGASDYILYTFQLINPRTSEIVWEGMEEIKKAGLSDAVYR